MSLKEKKAPKPPKETWQVKIDKEFAEQLKQIAGERYCSDKAAYILQLALKQFLDRELPKKNQPQL